jgi:hypothetical protein
MLDIDSFLTFKSASEEKWARISIKDTVWGFQIQAQTRWNPGLTDDAIAQYEEAITTSFPRDFKTFLKCMNGTDIPAIDVRGTSGEPPRFAPGFYSYPRDLELVKNRIELASTDKAQLAVTLEEQGFHLPANAKLIPVYAHRYLVCSPSADGSPVLSIWNSSDAIVYGRSLLDYLEREVLSGQ